MMRLQRLVTAGLKPGRTDSDGQMLGERYSGKVAGEKSAVGRAHSSEGSR